MTEKLLHIMKVAEENPAAAARMLRALMAREPGRFVRAAVELLTDQAETPGSEGILKFLASSEQALESLCDPNLFSRDVSVQIARRMAGVERQLDTKLVRLLPRRNGQAPESIPTATVERTLDLLDAASKCARIIPALTHLLQDPNPRVRAKATLLIGRRVQNTRVATSQLQESDARVRASAIESLWGEKSPTAINVLWSAAGDRNNRVAGNALLGLYRAKENKVIPRIIQMAQDPTPGARATAAWVIGQTGDPRFLPVLEKLGRDLYALVRKNAAKATTLMGGLMEAPSNLHLHILRSDVLEEYRTVWLRVSGAAGETMKGVAPSQFVVWSGQNLVTDYEVEEQCPNGILAAGLALCRDDAVPAATALLEQKKPEQLWAIARFQSAEGQSSDTAAAVYVADPNKLKAALAEPPLKAAASGATLAAMRSLLQPMIKIAGSRHLILLPESPFEASSEIEPLVATAVRHGVAIHALVSGSSADFVKGMCDRTGGICVTIGEGADLGAELGELYSALTSHYRIRFREVEAEPGSQSTLRVQVYGGQGRGECSARITAATPPLVSV
jgi:HEAT repeat protein